jgi:N-acetylglucosaminyldiphosphoundecaprenol N-acetyl-beta-D-mannosaminyltransferase
MRDKPKLNPPPRVNVLGVGVSVLNLQAATNWIDQAIQSGVRGYVCVTGVHGVSEARRSDEFRTILNSSLLNTPDGMPMVWMGRLLGWPHMRRVYGPDLMLALCQLSIQRGYSHFFYGGGESVAQELGRKLEARYPGLKIVGTYTPPYRPLKEAERAELVATVSKLKPDFFWVGLSTPKQEKFMAEHWTLLDAKIFFGVGAAFDIHAGRVPQAPPWMQSLGLEWLFRLACEPKRLWRRYLVNNPVFVARAFAQLTGLRRYPVEYR